MPESGPPRSLGSKLAQGFLVCAPQAAAYGVCIRANVEGNLAKDVCADSFQQLRTCVMRAAKAKPARLNVFATSTFCIVTQEPTIL